MCHVDLVGDACVREPKKEGGYERATEFEIAKDMRNEDNFMHEDMRANMSITKSIVDYYQNYKNNIGHEDLISLYRHSQEYIYAICK